MRQYYQTDKGRLLKWMMLALLTSLLALGQLHIAYASADRVEPVSDQNEQTAGILVVGVVAGSPAEEAGIVRGDVLLSANGQEIGDVQTFAEWLAGLEVESAVELSVQHGDELRTVDVTLAAREGKAFLGIQPYVEWAYVEPPIAVSEATGEAAVGMPYPSVGMSETKVISRTEVTATSGSTGIVTVEVTPGSPAEQAGLKPGDMILALDGESITLEADPATQLSAYEPGDSVVLTVRPVSPVRESVPITVTLEMHPEDETKPYLGIRYGSIVHRFVVGGDATPSAVPPVPFQPERDIYTDVYASPHAFWYGALSPPPMFFYDQPEYGTVVPGGHPFSRFINNKAVVVEAGRVERDVTVWHAAPAVLATPVAGYPWGHVATISSIPAPSVAASIQAYGYPPLMIFRRSALSDGFGAYAVHGIAPEWAQHVEFEQRFIIPGDSL